MRRYVLVAFLMFVLCFGTASARYIVGDSVNDFTLLDAFGNEVSLSDYSDQLVVMYFWSID